MRIGRMIAPVRALGPGERVCLWMQGCGKKCRGCISPELQSDDGPQVPVELVAKLICEAAVRNNCKGLTISGGEPFDQPKELESLLRLVRHSFSDILVYTGYTMEQIRDRIGMTNEKWYEKYVDVLIDGPYIEEDNINTCVLRGSANQVVHFLNPKVEDQYREYMMLGRAIETFSHGGNIIHVGILNRGE